ncbi:mechanosensitive ion channel protein MscS [Desulfobacter hydrogenophilus]|uniref:Mechanosensitive ion channel n=2 Tax=Desulfobacter hydrogenophilus TaxID=2291 RepID=A0A328FJ63_9BACT|nr:mechanosensitive ion channel [Desulfobacter hydrogenophilus]QBH15482.1 mechanosensitive ion channel [Desulfobacter hydrogenophilus]RAM03213.1 mechanosensitive ion channel protein MscS [Desulfobacter hydrogenophilus]
MRHLLVILNFLLMLSVFSPLFTYAVGEELLNTDAVLSSQYGESKDDQDNKKTVTTGDLTEKNTVIETKPGRVNDGDIKKRITGIFSEIEGLGKVSVSVREGVVSLEGETPNEKKALQAVNLANRVSDVVTVADSINRTLDVQDNVTPMIADLKQRARGLIKALPLLFVAILAFGVVTWFGVWLSRRNSLWQSITPNLFVAELLSQTVKVIFIVLGLILGLSLMGAEAIIGTLLGGAGVIGLAVGFAVKDTIENYISSLMLSVRQPFRARDYVNIDGQEGLVVRLTSRATILMTLDGNQLRIPNSKVFKGTILNYTKNPERRFTFELGVDANDDPIAAIKVGLDAINTLEFVLETPKATAVISQVGDSNIVLDFRVWVNQAEADFLIARSIAIREAKHALENHGFSLPEPIYRLRFNDDVEESIKQLNFIVNTGFQPNPSDGQSTMGVTSNTTPAAVNKAAAERDKSVNTYHDKLEKVEAKARAKQILDGVDAEDMLDAQPNSNLMEKLEEEIKENTGDKDLLSQNSLQE